MFKLLMFILVCCIILGAIFKSNINLKARGIFIVLISVFAIFYVVPGVIGFIINSDSKQTVSDNGYKSELEIYREWEQEGSTYAETVQGSTNSSSEEPTEEITLPENLNLKNYYTLKYGELLDVKESDNKLIIKAKITPNLTNDLTIKQNYYNIEDLVKNQRVDNYDSLDYWAVADMTNGEEVKVISFTVYGSILELIKEDVITAYDLGDYVDDLYVHRSLQ